MPRFFEISYRSLPGHVCERYCGLKPEGYYVLKKMYGVGHFEEEQTGRLVNTAQFLTAFRSLVNYHRICGIEWYKDGVGLQKTLNTLDEIEPCHPDEPPLQHDVPQGLKAAQPKGEDNNEVRGPLSIPELAAEIATCRNCSLHESRQIDTAGRGGNQPGLLIVGDWLMLPDGVAPEGAELFGGQQDVMLSRMIAAINLGPEEVFITNAIKCSIPDSCQPTSEHVTACSNYLQSQIETLSPLIICSMGIIASRLLTGKSQPLSQLRGRFSTYRTASGRAIPVMPTYHPGFLLQNPEMKQATWADLQIIEKELRKKSQAR